MLSVVKPVLSEQYTTWQAFRVFLATQISVLPVHVGVSPCGLDTLVEIVCSVLDVSATVSATQEQACLYLPAHLNFFGARSPSIA